MPGIYEDGWSDGFSNVVCIKTKSLNAPSNEEPTTYQIKPIVRTRYTRTNHENSSEITNGFPGNHDTISSSTTLGYNTSHGTSRINLMLKKPDNFTSNCYLTQLPPRPRRPQSVATITMTSPRPQSITMTSPRRRVTHPRTSIPHVRRFSTSPVEVISSSLSFPVEHVSSTRIRSSSLPPLTPHARRYSVTSSDYARNSPVPSLKYISDYGSTENGYDYQQLRAKTQEAKEKLELHRSLLDRYLPTNGSQSYNSYNHSEPAHRLPEYERYRSSSVSGSRRPSISGFYLTASASGSRRPSISGIWSTASSRASSMDRSDTAFNSHHSTPKVMSEARRKIRQVLYKVSGDIDYLCP